MLIDWFTIVAQIVNFLVLLVLLRYFLYGRILAAMDNREQQLIADWDDAKHERSAAAREREDAEKKNRELDLRRERMLSEMRDEVNVRRQELTAQAREEVDRTKQRWATAIREETASFLRDLRGRASAQICDVARNVLADLANADLEQQMVASFLNEIEKLDDIQRRAVVASLDGNQQRAVVQTSYELPQDLQSEIVGTLRRRLLENLTVRFEQAADLVCGISLQTGSHRLAWDVRDYLASLEQQLRATLDQAASRDLRRPGSVGTEN